MSDARWNVATTRFPKSKNGLPVLMMGAMILNDRTGSIGISLLRDSGVGLSLDAIRRR